ncbi:hypothetical protein MA16_Dca011935 [Dendrobium catenatum]|uniref:Uncharacterized protein n=1 Tax=Dendrobium catenatum TaxID=906689 RepID=A0A2I0WWZ5_9ASPA|nr:hypothetical protein MA16_Dca011935 [Dendrobium catenatum]
MDKPKAVGVISMVNIENGGLSKSAVAEFQKAAEITDNMEHPVNGNCSILGFQISEFEIPHIMEVPKVV